MKRNRIIFFTIWILSLISISFFSGPVSYGFFAVTTLLFVASLVYLLFVFIFFHIYQKTEGVDIVVNENIPFFFSLVNDYYFPFVGVSVKFFSSFSTINGLSDDIEYELMPHTGINQETGLICHYRGEYEVGIKTVVIEDFLRLFKITYKNPETKRVVVRPQIVYLESIGDFDVEKSINESRFNPSEPDLLSRDYVPGDDKRSINWSQSARTGKLLVRQKIGTDKSKVSIIMDTKRYSNKDIEFIPLENKVLETAIALSLYFYQKRIPLNFYYETSEFVKTSLMTESSFDNFYRMISDIDFDEKFSLDKLMLDASASDDIFNSFVVFLIVEDVTVSTYELIKKLSLNNTSTIVFYISDIDRQIPDFKDNQRVKLYRLNSASDLREAVND